MKEAVIFVRGFVTVDVDKKDKYFLWADGEGGRRLFFFLGEGGAGGSLFRIFESKEGRVAPVAGYVAPSI